MHNSSVPPNTVVPDQPALAQPSRPDEPLTIALYFPLEGMLASGSVAVKRQPDGQSQARVILAAMLGDQRVAQTALLKDVRLRELYIDASGTAYVDLTLGPAKGRSGYRHGMNSWPLRGGEYAFAEHRRDQARPILLDGREAQTLAGHIDLSRAFSKRMDREAVNQPVSRRDTKLAKE
jgi:hypothetical protein